MEQNLTILNKPTSKFFYFISYAWNRGTMSGFGCLQVVLEKEITSFDQIQEILVWLKANTLIRETQVDMSILSYQLLRVETPEDTKSQYEKSVIDEDIKFENSNQRH